MINFNGFINPFLSRAFLLVLFVSVSSCSSGEKEREIEMDKMWKQSGEKLTEEVENSAVLLSLKYDLSNRKIEQILYDYLREYDNYSHQLITTKTFDIEKYKASWDKKPPSMPDYIENATYRTQVPEKIVAGLILDYRFLGYQEEVDYLDSEIEDLKYNLQTRL